MMSFMECPSCGGTGRVDDPTGEKLVCPICEGTGVLPPGDDVPEEVVEFPDDES
jgi:hypothetical protein